MRINGTPDKDDRDLATRPKIVIHNLYKIFGPRPQEILRRLQAGEFDKLPGGATQTLKNYLLEHTGHALAINNVSFSVGQGEMLVIMGLSGSGKSTLIRCINRLITPTAGTILIDGEDVVTVSEDRLREIRRKKVAMVFQQFGLFSHRTVLGNVEFGLEIQGIPGPERQARALEALAIVGLKGWEQHYPHMLSGGMQQRVGLARALATDPDILLMDEPFSALDPLIRQDMQNELLELQSKLNKTIVFITHDLDEAIRLGDRIAVMRDGEIVQLDTPENILQKPESTYVASFVSKIDPTKILTAGHIMQHYKATARVQDGPRVALRIMQQAGLSSLFVVDRSGRLQGLVTADDAVKAIADGMEDLRSIVITDIPVVDASTPFRDLLPIGVKSKYPIAVVDDNRVLKGIIVRATIIAGMMQGGDRGQTDHQEGDIHGIR